MTRDLPLADPAVHGELPPEQLDAWMDLLVDGEVREPQRQALLSRLERLPDGWRRCALAFLESQAWREALDPVAVRSAYGDSINEANSEANSAANPAGINLAAINLAGMAPQLTADAPSLPAASAPSVLHPRMAWRWQPWLGMVAAAASFVIAFGLGSLVQRAWFAPGSTGEGVSRNFADGPPGAGSSSDDPRSIAAAKQPQWGTVRLAVDGPSGARSRSTCWRSMVPIRSSGCANSRRPFPTTSCKRCANMAITCKRSGATCRSRSTTAATPCSPSIKSTSASVAEMGISSTSNLKGILHVSRSLAPSGVLGRLGDCCAGGRHAGSSPGHPAAAGTRSWRGRCARSWCSGRGLPRRPTKDVT